MPVVDHNNPLPSCKGPDCRALATWRDKYKEAASRLEIAEKAALACSRPLVWTDDPPQKEGWYFMQVRIPGKPLRIVHVHRVPAKPRQATSGMLCVSQTPQDDPPGTPLCELDPTNRFWAGPIPEPVEPKE